MIDLRGLRPRTGAKLNSITRQYVSLGKKNSETNVINWSLFDKIYCIHYLPYKERFETIKSELKRVGILDLPQFEFYETIDNEFYESVLFDKSIEIDRVRTDSSNIKLTIDSYSLLKKIQLKGYERVLIIEDDVIFHRDLGYIGEVIQSTPKDFDVMNYDPQIAYDDSGIPFGEWQKVDDNISRYQNACVVNMSCCALSKKAVSHIIDKQKQLLQPFDIYTWSDTGDLNTYCISNGGNICIQDVESYMNKQSSIHHQDKYVNIDISKYGDGTRSIVSMSNETQVVVSLTSYPHRFTQPEFLDVLKSLVRQNTQYRFKVALTLFKDDISLLPKDILRYIYDCKIDLITCDEDIKSHKKYYYAMQTYDVPIITVDDDMVYKNNLVEDLYRTHLENPGYVACGRCDLMVRDENNEIQPSKKWNTMPDISGFKDDDLFGIGVGGILYPLSFCKTIDERILQLMKVIKPDDFMLYILARMYGLKYMNVETNNLYNRDGGGGFFCHHSLDYHKDEYAMWVKNKTHNIDDECIKFIGKYQNVDQLLNAINADSNQVNTI